MYVCIYINIVLIYYSLCMIKVRVCGILVVCDECYNLDRSVVVVLSPPPPPFYFFVENSNLLRLGYSIHS